MESREVFFRDERYICPKRKDFSGRKSMKL